MNKLIYYPFLFLLSFFSFPRLLVAQTSRDTLLVPAPLVTLPPADTVKARFILADSLSYRFMGDGNFSRGNVNRSLVVLRAEIILLGPNLDLVTHPRFTYGEQNSLLAERDIYADLFVDVFKKKKIYAFGLATIEKSNLRQIDWRQLAGAGIGFRFLQTRHHKLSLTNALLYESTDFRERPTISIQRNSTRLKGRHTFMHDKIRLNHITFWQPSLSDPANVRWNTLITLEMPLTWWLSIRTSYENSYEGIVEANRKHHDSRLTFGISVGNRHL